MEQSISEMSSFKRLMAALQARKEWEAAHPKLAAAWTEALREDAQWEQRREYERAVAQANVAIPDRLRMLGVPKLACETLEAKPDDTPSMKAARRYWESTEHRWLVLLGKASTGKTVAAAWILGKWLASHSAWTQPTAGGPRPELGCFVSATELSGMSDYRDEDKAYIQRLSKCGLLVLDDLGAERLGEMELGIIQRVLMYRHSGLLRTVITSNLAMGEADDRDGTTLYGRYGARIVERMREVARVVDAGSKGLRGRKQEAR